MSHLLQRDLSGLWCSGFLWCLVFVFFGLFAWGLFGLFLALFLGSLCHLHALALSLTGAQRTESSFASKKKAIQFKGYRAMGTPIKTHQRLRTKNPGFPGVDSVRWIANIRHSRDQKTLVGSLEPNVCADVENILVPSI